ncbi:MAG: energy-coupling factor transporter ATP-binding protein EcfA2, partial [Phenylobacterium sp.]
MFIKKISYQSDEVVLQDVEFQKINVLVGASGAGKTTIMDCINTIGHIADGNSYPGVSWRIEFTDGEKRHVIWSGVFSADLDYDDDEEVIAKLSSESVEIDGEEIVYRDATGFYYLGAKLPALDDTKSAIFHLKTDGLIQPVYSVFDSTVFIS